MGKFRGTWNASVATPAFNAFQFLPTAPAMKPRVRVESEEAKPEVVEIELESGSLLDGPPVDAEVLISIKDRYSYVSFHESIVLLLLFY